MTAAAFPAPADPPVSACDLPTIAWRPGKRTIMHTTLATFEIETQPAFGQTLQQSLAQQSDEINRAMAVAGFDGVTVVAFSLKHGPENKRCATYAIGVCNGSDPLTGDDLLACIDMHNRWAGSL